MGQNSEKGLGAMPVTDQHICSFLDMYINQLSDPRLVTAIYRSNAGVVVESSLDRVPVSDVADGQPVREFRWYKGRRHYSGWYWSSTTQRMVVYESRLELARIMLADFDPSVVSIAAQPLQLKGVDGDRSRRHVPDLLLMDRDGGVTVVDVKSPHKRDDPKVRALMTWTRNVVGLRGWDFEEWYGAPQSVLANVFFLAGYRRRTVVDQSLPSDVVAAVGEGSTIADVERVLAAGDVASVRPVVLHLLWTGMLATDLNRPLDGLSVVRPGNVLEASR
jgi:hypothetical protein